MKEVKKSTMILKNLRVITKENVELKRLIIMYEEIEKKHKEELLTTNAISNIIAQER